MGMMKHKHTCLIMAMLSNNNNTNNVLTKLPKEVLEHIVGFIDAPQCGAVCNTFGVKVVEYASFYCRTCNRPRKREMITLSHDGTSSCAFDPHDFNYHERIRLWNAHCAANKSSFTFWGMARKINRIDRVLARRGKTTA